jgi:hypothetical protein
VDILSLAPSPEESPAQLASILMSTDSLSYPQPDESKYGTVVFDLDGILAEKVWPQRYTIGAPLSEGVRMLRYYADKGYSITIWTSRPWEDEDSIWQWVRQNSLPVDRVVCEKPVAALYIDDKAYKPEWA